MKHSFLNLLEDFGIVWKYVINGLVGGFIWSLYKKSKFWEAFRQILIGGVISGYFSPVVITHFEMDLSLAGFTSFVIGMLGMVIIDSAYKYAVGNYKKWGLILKILFTKQSEETIKNQ
jgi:fructose-specific phosphotransferase system IIC component